MDKKELVKMCKKMRELYERWVAPDEVDDSEEAIMDLHCLLSRYKELVDDVLSSNDED